MSDPRTLRSNERWKAISTILFQLGAVLLSAAAVEIYRANRLTLETSGWLTGSGFLIFVGWKVLILLEAES